MKIRNILIGIALLASGTANAVTVFAPTDGDVNFILSSLPAGTTLAIFDDSDQTFIGSNLDVPIPQLVAFTGPFSGDFTATNEAAATLTLTGSDNFILGISMDGGASWSGDTSVTLIGANSYAVGFINGTVLEVDVQVIPVPAAVWLFGSGLLGLVGIARRRKTA